MEKARFEEAKKQYDIINNCEGVHKSNDNNNGLTRNNFIMRPIEHLLSDDSSVFRSFIRWVKNEKAIAEQKFKEI